MSTDIEQLLRESLERQADRAVHPDRVWAGVPARAHLRARKRRYRGMVVAASALAVAVVALAVPAVVGNHPAGDRLPTGGGTEAANALRPATPPGGALSPPVAEVAMRYDITYVPPGLRERGRSVQLTADGVVEHGPIRTWTRNTVTDRDLGGARMELYVMGGQYASTEGASVDISGTGGYYVDDGNKSYLHWQVDADTVLQVSQNGAGLSRQELLRVAESVRPSSDLLRIPVRAGWLPHGVSISHVDTTGDSPMSWQTVLSGRPAEWPDANGVADKNKLKEDTTPEVQVTLGTGTSAPAGGEQIAVGGEPARYVVQRYESGPWSAQHVVVDLGGGLLLTVSGTGTWERADLLSVAEHVQVDSRPDLSWLGTR